jgi:hypothetical protein
MAVFREDGHFPSTVSGTQDAFFSASIAPKHLDGGLGHGRSLHPRYAFEYQDPGCSMATVTERGGAEAGHQARRIVAGTIPGCGKGSSNTDVFGAASEVTAGDSERDYVHTPATGG